VINASDEDTNNMLKKLIDSDNIYVRRGAAKALIKMGDMVGFPILIDSLVYRSIDVSNKNHPENVLNFLIEYSGNPLGDVPSAWRNWWLTAEKTMDLKRNISARGEFERIFTDIQTRSREKTVASLNALRQKFPDYNGFNYKIAPQLYQFANEALNRSKSKTQLAMALTRLASEMDPTVPEYIHTYIEILINTGKSKEAILKIEDALKLFPNDRRFINLLNRIDKS